MRFIVLALAFGLALAPLASTMEAKTAAKTKRNVPHAVKAKRSKTPKARKAKRAAKRSRNTAN